MIWAVDPPALSYSPVGTYNFTEMGDKSDNPTLRDPVPFQVGDWQVDPSAQRISNRSHSRKLEPKTMALLCELAARPGVVVTRQELEERVWSGSVVGYDALSNAVIKLRRALGDQARSPTFIETISKSGYRLIAPVTRQDIQGTKDGDGAGKRLPRRLAAILYADVAEYSRMTHDDEDGTHRQLSDYLDQFVSAIEDHRGRVMHFAGDAILAMFTAAVDAVESARQVQYILSERNLMVRADRQLWFRIGINLGDVFEDRGDVYGDGVNVAARLEALASAGDIVVSESIRSAIGKSAGFGFRFIGEKKLKNIAEPVRAYVLAAGDAARPSSYENRTVDEGDRPSIAVLPFDNMSNDPEQTYFSDGISEDITTDLSKNPGLLVIARNSAFSYRGSGSAIKEIARDLGVRYVLEGSVRRSGGRVRINAQLIDAGNSSHVWADRYDREMTDLFQVQDEVSQAIVMALAPALMGEESASPGSAGSHNMEAYDYFLKGREQAMLDTAPSNELAQKLLQKAIDIEPAFSNAYAYLGRCYSVAYINRWNGASEPSLEKAIEAGRKAIAIDEMNPMGYFVVGTAAFWQHKNDLALQEIRRAIEIDPNFAEGYGAIAMVQLFSGQSEQAIESLRTTMRLDPHYRDIYLHFSGQAHFHLGRYDEAAEALKRRLIRKPESDVSRVLLASTYGHLGDAERARAHWQEALRLNPDYSIESKRKMLPYKNPADFEQIVEGLTKADIMVEGNS